MTTDSAAAPATPRANDIASPCCHQQAITRVLRTSLGPVFPAGLSLPATACIGRDPLPACV
ncbi:MULTISPECIES: hypothetical protein [Cupriavidus]